MEEAFGEVDSETLIRCSAHELEERIERVLDTRHIDGFFAADEDASMAICKVAKKKGIRIPDQLSVIGYAGEKLAENLTPGLTTMNQNGVSIGREAARIMLERIESREDPFTKKIIETTIEMRASTLRKK